MLSYNLIEKKTGKSIKKKYLFIKQKNTIRENVYLLKKKQNKRLGINLL